ncbi:MAG TPA: hypothetical protein VFE37_02785 [Chloroflexota bacterium]|nr:hypothetical protein [Chloroflexota bacterium]
MAERGAERDLDAALAALVEAALRRAAAAGDAPPAEQTRLVAQALAAGLRELVRAPLREALQAGYDLGWRAAQDAQRQAAGAAPSVLPVAPDTRAAGPSAADPAPAAPLPAPPPADAAPGPHQVRLEIGPLPNFSAVNRFHAAVAGVPGVADTTMVAFRDGRLTLQVEHPDGVALAAALRTLDLGPLRVLAATPDHVELALDSRPPMANGRLAGREGCWRPPA